MSSDVSKVLQSSRIIDLSQPLQTGMPQSPNHAPFRMIVERRHGDMRRDDGGSAANDVLMTGTHVGTHVDALGHVSHEGELFGNTPTAGIQDHRGLKRFGIEEFTPFVGRAVVLDICAVKGVKVLDAGYEVTVEDLENALQLAQTSIEEGDAILVGSGWSRCWDQPDMFVGSTLGAPGPGAAAGLWLAAHKPVLVGGETLAFEHVGPGRGHGLLPVHRQMLVQYGIHIVETMRLADLLDARVGECGLIVNPLLITGATGAPVRPLALL